MSRPSADASSALVEEFSGMSTAAIGALLESRGIAGRCAGLASTASRRFCGRAFTVQFLPVGPPDGRTPDGSLGDFLADVPAGYVIALDNRGDRSVAVWSDALSRAALEQGVAGVVIDGCSDAAPPTAALPLFSAGRVSGAPARRVRTEAFNLPVAIGGVRVECDDIILGDADGVVVVPKDHIRAILDVAKKVVASSWT